MTQKSAQRPPTKDERAGLPVAKGITISTTPPTTHDYAGSNSDRQSIGLPGHCEVCAQHGHVVAHPEYGCGDVGCASPHPVADETTYDDDGFALDENGIAWGHCNSCGEEAPAYSECCDDGEVVSGD